LRYPLTIPDILDRGVDRVADAEELQWILIGA